MIGKKSPNIFWKEAKTVAKPNKAKIYTRFLNSLFSWKCNKLVAKGVTIFGAISTFQKNPNEPTKSSPIVEKFAQSGHPN